jgi:hypothetical protein
MFYNKDDNQDKMEGRYRNGHRCNRMFNLALLDGDG